MFRGASRSVALLWSLLDLPLRDSAMSSGLDVVPCDYIISGIYNNILFHDMRTQIFLESSSILRPSNILSGLTETPGPQASDVRESV